MGNSMRSRIGEQHDNIVPDVTRSLLQSRADHQEMIDWQEGGGEDTEEGGDSGPSAVTPVQPRKKFDHPTICGIDKRPFFPTVLLISLLWSMGMTGLQSEVVTQICGSTTRCNIFFLTIYLGTIGCALYTSLSDPGLMEEEQFKKWQAGQVSLPLRAHKHWLYKRPVLRFHQYCRWVTNCIGLRNHRSYMMMLVGFVTIAVVDAVVDFILVAANFFNSGGFIIGFLLLLHLLYSVYFAWYAGPLLRQHVNFVMRNELTQEWKRDEYYIVRNEFTGEKVWVNDLDTEDYNRLFDTFEYDQERNSFDKGVSNNLMSFWLTSRWDASEWGEF